MTAANKIVICNFALDHLGKDNVLNLTSTDAGRRCGRQYDHARRTSLMRSPWTFARKTKALSVQSTNVLSDLFEYAYDIPKDCLKIVRLVEIDRGVDDNTPPIPYYISNGFLYTNLEGAHLLYVFDNTDTAAWSDLFDDVVAIMIAIRVAPALTRRKSDIKDLRDAYDATLGIAMDTDAAQDQTTYRFGDGYVDARGAGMTERGRQTDGSSIWG